MSNITKGLTEAFGRYDRRDAYQRDYDSSVAGMGKRQSLAYQLDGGANDEGWDEPQRDYTPKPVAKKGMYFYNVPADQDAKAQEVGLFRTKSGKWYSPFQNTRADMFFGKGRYWEPKTNESQLDELSNDTLASYKKKAGADASAADKAGDYKRGDKRFSGIVKATKKQFDNDSKGVAEDDAGDVEQRMLIKIEKEKQRLAHLKKTDPEAYKREMAKREQSRNRMPAVSTFEQQGVAEDTETYKQGHAKFHTKTNKQIGPTHYGRGSDKKADSYTKADPRYHEVRPVKEQGVAEGWIDTIKNVFKRKPRDNRSVFEKDPEAMREFERSGGYEAGLDIMGWQIGWFAAEHAQGDTMQQAFSKLYYGGGSPMPFDNRSFKLAWVAYNKHHGPQIAEQDVAEGSSGVSVRQWANQVRKDHGADVKFRNRQEGGGAVDSIIAKNSQGETVGVYNRKTGYPTVYEPKQGVAEGPEFDKWADDRAASQLHKLKPATLWEVSFDYGPHQSDSVKVKARSEEEAIAKVETAAEKKGRSIMVNWARPAEQDIEEEKQRLDPKCWKGYKKQGTKMKGDTRVNNCVPVKESAIMKGLK